MKVKIREILESSSVLQKLTTTSLPVKTSYNILRNTRKISQEIEPFEKARTELVAKYGTEDESGKIVVTDSNLQIFYKEVGELLDEEIEVDIRPIKIDDLSDVKLSASELQLIDYMIVKED